MKKYIVDMTEGPVIKKMILFAIPIILSGILQHLYNAADTVIVGHFSGKESLAAVGSTTSLIGIFTNFFIGISSGACVTLARFIGMKNKKSASNTVHTSITLGIIFGIFVSISGFFLCETALRLMNSPEDVIGKATLYLKVYFCGMPAVLLYNFGSSVLRAVGDSKRPMYILIVSGIINVLLNLIFVIHFRLDVTGVALATIISQLISAICVIVCIIKEKEYCHLDLKKLKIHKNELSFILKNGLPAGVQSCIFTLSNIQIQTALNGFGSSVLAGHAAAGNITNFIHISFSGFTQATLTFTSQNFGAGKTERIKKVMLCSIGFIFVLGTTLGASCLIFADKLLGIYSSDAEIQAFGKIYFNYICPLYFGVGFFETFSAGLRGLGYSFTSMITSLVGVCGFRMVWVSFVFPHFKTLGCLFLSYPITWFATWIIQLCCYIVIMKKSSS